MNKKEHIFNIFSNNLTKLFPAYTDVYACPLCKILFTKDAIKNGELTLEHIIPNALDGKLYVLLCKNCNSLCGRQLDIHLINQLESINIFSGKSDKPLKVTMSIENNFTRGDLYINTDKSFHMKIKSNVTEPKQGEQFRELIKRGDSDINLNGDLGYNQKKVNIALLKIGYFALFRLIGYIALHDSYDLIRQQIANPNKTIFKPLIFNLDECITDNYRFAYSKIDNKKYFFIIINQKYINKNVAVILPDPFNFNYDSYLNLHKENNCDIIKFNCTEILINQHSI